MKNKQKTIESDVADFVDALRRRLNQHHFNDMLVRACLLGGIAMLFVALFFVLQGYAVPLVAYAWVIAVSIAAVCVFACFGRCSRDLAAMHADQFFGLKDSVISCTHFTEEGKSGAFYDLQADQTRALVSESSLSQIKYILPVKWIMLASVVIIIATALGFKGPSEKVIQRLKDESTTLGFTKTANQELKQLMEELDKSIDDPGERKLLQPDTLRKWVKDLENTIDRKEAMRQYARLELRLKRAANALSQRREEKLLDKAAQELRKSEQHQELAKKLKSKKYKSAAQYLEKMNPSKLNPVDLKRLSEKRKELAKLKAAAKRMAEAARSTIKRSNRSTQHSNGKKSAGQSHKNSQSSTHQSGQYADQDADGNPVQNDELSEMIEDLEESVDAFDEALEELEQLDFEDIAEDWDDNEECENCKICQSDVQNDLKKLSQKLKRMAKKRSAHSKLKSLCKKCSQCQSQCQSTGTMLAKSKSSGGIKAGKGTSDGTRNQRDELIDNDQTTALKGIKGIGPSLSTTQQADDGTGVSRRKKNALQRDFKKQFESFVEREDIPEDLKNGVKNYFTNIHQQD